MATNNTDWQADEVNEIIDIEWPNDLEIISPIWVDDLQEQTLIIPSDIDDLPELVPLDDQESLPSNTIKPDANLRLDELNKYITSPDELDFIKSKLINLEQLITTKLDKYHRAVRNYERSRRNKFCGSRTTNSRCDTKCEELPNVQSGETRIINHGTIIYTQPATDSNPDLSANPSANPYVIKWLSKFKPVLENLFNPEQQTDDDIKYFNTVLGSMMAELTQYTRHA
jgi:hypothetical protein